jgi:hypothetical protein
MSPDEKTIQIAFRLPEQLVAELDALVGVLKAQNPPGLRITRTDVAIAALTDGVASIRAKYAAGGKRPKRI